MFKYLLNKTIITIRLRLYSDLTCKNPLLLAYLLSKNKLLLYQYSFHKILFSSRSRIIILLWQQFLLCPLRVAIVFFCFQSSKYLPHKVASIRVIPNEAWTTVCPHPHIMAWVSSIRKLDALYTNEIVAELSAPNVSGIINPMRNISNE